MDKYTAILKVKAQTRSWLDTHLAQLLEDVASAEGTMDPDSFLVHVDGQPSHYGAVVKVQVPAGTPFQPGTAWHVYRGA